MSKRIFVAWPLPALLATAGVAQAQDCEITVGLVMELTGPAGEYGQAGAKSVEMAFRDINDAGGVERLQARHRHARLAEPGQRRGRRRDAARPGRRRCRSIIGGIISSVSIPILTSVTGAGRRRAGLAGLLVADADRARPRRQDQRRLLPHHHLGRAAGHGGGEIRARPGAEEALDHPRQQRFRRQHGRRVHARPTRRSAARSSRITPYNENQASYQAEVTAAMEGEPGRRSISSAIPVDGATIARHWISQGGPQKFLLNDGMNSADFITNVGAEYLNDAFGTSSGTSPTRLDRIFQRQLQGILRASIRRTRRPTAPTTPAPSSASPSRRPARRSRRRSRTRSARCSIRTAR